jgi:hypothetical protein
MHMGAWLSWPAALARTAEQRDAINSWTVSVTVYWGATFSLVILAAYIPCGLLLLSRARKALKSQMSDEQIDSWLKEYSLTVAPKDQITRLMIILAPVLAGPVGAMISRALGAKSD